LSCRRMAPMSSTAWLAGAVAAWATALYVLTRGGGRRISLSASFAMAALALYMLGAATGSPTWERSTWWAAVVGTAVWLGLAQQLAAEEAGGRVPVEATGATLVLAAAAGAAGTAGNWIVDWSTGAFGPGYPLFAGLELLIVAAPVAILDRARR